MDIAIFFVFACHCLNDIALIQAGINKITLKIRIVMNFIVTSCCYIFLMQKG